MLDLLNPSSLFFLIHQLLDNTLPQLDQFNQSHLQETKNVAKRSSQSKSHQIHLEITIE